MRILSSTTSGICVDAARVGRVAPCARTLDSSDRTTASRATDARPMGGVLDERARHLGGLVCCSHADKWRKAKKVADKSCHSKAKRSDESSHSFSSKERSPIRRLRNGTARQVRGDCRNVSRRQRTLYRRIVRADGRLRRRSDQMINRFKLERPARE